jgi:hypothetical protein
MCATRQEKRVSTVMQRIQHTEEGCAYNHSVDWDDIDDAMISIKIRMSINRTEIRVGCCKMKNTIVLTTWYTQQKLDSSAPITYFISTSG